MHHRGLRTAPCLHVVLRDPDRAAWRLRVALDSADAGAATALVFTPPVAGFEQMAPDVHPHQREHYTPA